MNNANCEDNMFEVDWWLAHCWTFIETLLKVLRLKKIDQAKKLKQIHQKNGRNFWAWENEKLLDMWISLMWEATWSESWNREKWEVFRGLRPKQVDKLLLREKMGGFRTKAVATVLLQLLFVQTSLAAANSSCAEALHAFLAKVFQILYFLDLSAPTGLD